MKAFRCRLKVPIPEGFYSSNTIFIHIPKAAGQSVSYAIYGCTTHNFKISEVLKADEKLTDKAFKFAVVRDPVDRFLSAVTYLQAGGRTNNDRLLAKSWGVDEGVMRFVKRLDGLDLDTIPELRLFHTQNSFLTLPRRPSRIVVDKIYRIHELQRLVRDFNLFSTWAFEVGKPKKVNAAHRGCSFSDRQIKSLNDFAKDAYSVDYRQFF